MGFEKNWLTGDNAISDTADPAVAALRGFLDNEPSVEAAAAIADSGVDGLIALAEVLTERQDGARLAALREVKLPKKARKLVGKAIHKLTSRGVSCDVPGPRVGTMGYAAEELPSYLSVSLPTGDQLMLLSAVVDGSPTTCYAVTIDTGLDELALIDSPSRTKLKRIIESIEEGSRDSLDVFFAEADPALVRSRLQAAVLRHRESNQPLPEDYAACRHIIDVGPTVGDVHPLLAELGDIEPIAMRRGEELLGHMVPHGDHHHYQSGPIDRFAWTDAWQNETSAKLKEASESPLVVDDIQRRQRIVDELERVVETTFTTEFRAAEAQRLMDTGYAMLRRRKNQDLAQVAAATARALLDEDQPALEIPWARESVFGVVDIDILIEKRGEDAILDHSAMTPGHE